MTAAIIIPAYNAAAFLAEAIDSALAQTHPAAQVIVVDDGSSDDTAAIAARYDDALVLLRQKNQGVSAARNHGAAHATAEWLLFLDADDRLRPNALEKLSARAQAADFGVVYGQTLHFGADADSWPAQGSPNCEGKPPAAAAANFWKSAIATPGAAMIRAKLLREIGGFASQLSTAADRDLWIKAGTIAEFGFLNSPVIERRVHGANMCGDLDRARIEATQAQFCALEWSHQRNVNTAFLQVDPTQIIERNLLRALETRSFRAVEWLCAEAQRRGVESSLVARARRYAANPPLTRELELFVRERIGAL